MRSWNTTHLIGKLVDCISKSGTSGISNALDKSYGRLEYIA